MDSLPISEVFSRYFDAYLKHFSEKIFEFSFENPFLFTFGCLMLAFILEAVLPRKIDYTQMKRKGFWLDLFYVLFYDLVIVFLGIYAIVFTIDHLFYRGIGFLGLTKESVQLIDLSVLPGIVHFIIIFLLIDFMEWLAHYVMHRFDFLWAIHKVHHANEEIGVASSRRFHLLEYLVFKPFAFIPVLFLGGIPKTFAVYYSFIIVFFAFFTHANSKIKIGFLNYIINNPNTHLWHHAMNFPNKYGVNFASVLNIWDVMFGVYYLPEDEKPKLGVHDMETMPKGFVGQFFYPFKYWFTNKTITNRYDLAVVKKSKKSKRKKNKNKNK